MDESLMQRRRVKDDGLRVVNFDKAPANYVPAAAVIRRVRALSGFTGRKEFCRRSCKLEVKSLGSTQKLLSILHDLRHLGDSGTYGGAVKCVDIIGNTKGVASCLGMY